MQSRMICQFAFLGERLPMQITPLSPPPVESGSNAVPPQTTPDRSFVMRYGRFIHRARWFIVLSWVLLLGASIPFAATISNKLQSSITQPSDTQSAQVNQQLVSTFHQPASQVLVVFHSTDVP